MDVKLRRIPKMDHQSRWTFAGLLEKADYESKTILPVLYSQCRCGKTAFPPPAYSRHGLPA